MSSKRIFHIPALTFLITLRANEQNTTPAVTPRGLGVISQRPSAEGDRKPSVVYQGSYAKQHLLKRPGAKTSFPLLTVSPESCQRCALCLKHYTGLTTSALLKNSKSDSFPRCTGLCLRGSWETTLSPTITSNVNAFFNARGLHESMLTSVCMYEPTCFRPVFNVPGRGPWERGKGVDFNVKHVKVITAGTGWLRGGSLQRLPFTCIYTDLRLSLFRRSLSRSLRFSCEEEAFEGLKKRGVWNQHHFSEGRLGDRACYQRITWTEVILIFQQYNTYCT